jgi:ATP-dependent DNA helicase RecQ
MSESDNFTKEIINYLILNDYLYTTNDEFPILRIGKFGGKFIKEKESISMKVVKSGKNILDNKSIEKGSSKSKSKSKKTADLHNVDAILLSKLKELRLSLAIEQKVPAFVIFPDSTLIDMCVKLPHTDEELLEVSGVGKLKLERYGAKFLKLITEHN